MVGSLTNILPKGVDTTNHCWIQQQAPFAWSSFSVPKWRRVATRGRASVTPKENHHLQAVELWIPLPTNSGAVVEPECRHERCISMHWCWCFRHPWSRFHRSKTLSGIVEKLIDSKPLDSLDIEASPQSPHTSMPSTQTSDVRRTFRTLFIWDR